MLHFVRLNSEHVHENSVAQERNHRVAAMITLGYMNELTGVLDHLSNAGIKVALRDPAPWLELRDVQRRWKRAARVTLRNEVLFHFGTRQKTTASIEKWAEAPNRVTLIEQDLGHGPWGVSYTGGDGLVMDAAGLPISEFVAVLEDAVNSYGPVLASLSRIVDDLLRQCGARMPELALHATHFFGLRSSKARL